ncbi:metallophosphoesterase family protein [Frankia sp. Cas3]|uniref:purple acid phosphatase family protein n=1 Tax=Frankia sp. Cas3 TaxID=3073926 RepID=UPI002AD30C53|nr:metallophosphoesterase family protein [Frankia sp. Cas3]
MKTPRMGIPDRLAERMSMAEQHEWLMSQRPSRRSVFRAGALGAGALLAGPSLLGSAASAGTGPTLATTNSTADGASVAPFARHLAFGADPRRQIRIGWQVPTPVRRPFIRIGTDPSDLSGRIPAEVRPLHSEVPGAAGPVDQYYLHVELDGLRPDTTYYYGVGHKGYEPASAAGAISTVHTAPQRGRWDVEPFTFTAFGDQGVSPHALANDGVVAQQNPAFHLLLGDIAYADPSGQGRPVSATGANGTDIFNPTIWDSYLGQIEAVASRVPWMVATGNHDMEALYSPEGYGGQIARWDFPGNGPKACPSVYSFIYGNVGVISLDANDVSNEIPANLGYSKGSQTSWLKSRLKFLRRQPDVDFIVVFFHHCTYSTTNAHASEGGVRAEWVPLFDAYRVDLVLNGHNHIYERSDPLRGGSPSKAVPIGGTIHPDTDGTTYLSVGGGGRSLYSFPAPDSYAGHVNDAASVNTYSWTGVGVKTPEVVTWSRVRYTGYSFVAVDVTPARVGQPATLTVRAVAESGAELDRVTLVRTAGLCTVGSRGVSDAKADFDAA